MSFKTDQVSDFLEVFESSKEKIRNFHGCEYLSLHRDHHSEHVFYTLSRWQSQADLDNYRHSDLFISTWAKTKVLFNAKPQAFSLEQLMEVGSS